MPLTESVLSSVEPDSTSMTLSPLMVNFTFPEGTRYFLATNRTITRISITARKTPMLAMINCVSMSF